MLYEKYFQLSEQTRWQLETDIAWGEIDVNRALAQPDVLDKLRQAAIIESYAPMFALKGLEVWWNSIEESAIASIQFYEEYKHYFALQRYLGALGIVIPEREIIEVREKSFGSHYTDRNRQLANYMISEHFTAYFYQRLLERTDEPVLQTLLGLLVKDEFKHCHIFYALLESRLERDRHVVDTILEEALDFRHQAAEVLGEHVPVAERNDFQALLHLWKRLETLTGIDLREFRKAHAG